MPPVEVRGITPDDFWREFDGSPFRWPSPEIPSHPAPKRPYEIYGLDENERLNWRVSDERFNAILHDESTLVHKIIESKNNYGEFLFVSTS